MFATPRAVAHQAPLSMELSRQEYRSGLLFPSPGIELASVPSPMLAGVFFTTVPPGKPHTYISGSQSRVTVTSRGHLALSADLLVVTAESGEKYHWEH